MRRDPDRETMIGLILGRLARHLRPGAAALIRVRLLRRPDADVFEWLRDEGDAYTWDGLAIDAERLAAILAPPPPDEVPPPQQTPTADDLLEAVRRASRRALRTPPRPRARRGPSAEGPTRSVGSWA